MEIGDMLLSVLITGAIGFSLLGSRMMFNVLNNITRKIASIILDINTLYRVVDDLIHPEIKTTKNYKAIRGRHRWNSLRHRL